MIIGTKTKLSNLLNVQFIFDSQRFISLWRVDLVENFNNKITWQLRLVKYNNEVGSNKTRFYA